MDQKMKTLLWLDDIRDPFVGDWLMAYAPGFAYGDGEVVWVKNFDDFVSHIKFKGIPDMISFDHDLGENSKYNGYEILQKITDMILDGEYKLPHGFQFMVHSKNPVGAENIRSFMNNFIKHMEG